MPFVKAMPAICSVQGCGRAHRARGYCENHYRLFQRNGSATTKRKAGNGEAFRWLITHYMDDTDECIVWPFSLKSNGYADFGRNGKKVHAHREACLLAYGIAPSANHEVAHNCGNRSCINARHLRWATRGENMGDKVIHGTQTRGELHSTAKLTATEVKEIRAARGIKSQSVLAECFGVSQTHVSAIQLGKRWSAKQ